MRRFAIALLLLVICAPLLPSLVPLTLQPAEQPPPPTPAAAPGKSAGSGQVAAPTVAAVVPTVPAPTPTPRLVALVRAGTGSLRSAPVDLQAGAHRVSWTVEPPPNLSVSSCPFVLELLGPDGRSLGELARGEAPRTGARGEAFVRAPAAGQHSIKATTDCAWSLQFDLPE